jgi:hypothetical protein
MTRYAGEEKEYLDGRYALEYGPILMAYVSMNGEKKDIRLPVAPEKLVKSLRPVAGKPLHFTVAGVRDFEYMPYMEVQDESFTCYP